MLYHLASHLSTIEARAESEESECEESESEEVTRVSLSHPQRDLVAPEEGIMHCKFHFLVLYQHFVEIKKRQEL